MAERYKSKSRALDKNALITSAKARISQVQAKPLTLEARIDFAIDLASTLLELASCLQTPAEKKQEALLCRMMQDPKGKAFTSTMLDSAFRTHCDRRLVTHVQNLLKTYGTPAFLRRDHKWLLGTFRLFGKLVPSLSAKFLRKFVQAQVKAVIAPGETEPLNKELKNWQKQAVKINLNRLGEAILGENEATKRFEQNLVDLANPLVEVISVKISSIVSQINLVAWNHTLNRLKTRLRLLFRACQKWNKQLTLDMEEYKDLALTVQLFQEVLNEPEFLQLSAGIALQSYIPESYSVLETLTAWAIKRRAIGGAPIKIRLVKGANLGMERVEASLKEWAQAPYQQKAEVDANFKKMLHFALQKDHCDAVQLGIGSHNLFDIAYALLLASEQEVQAEVTIEMLAGMAPHLARAIHEVWDNLLLYLPAAKNEEFHTAIAYLMRRLDENTAPDNFLTHLFGLQTATEAWKEQEERFAISCHDSLIVSNETRRTQNRKDLAVRVVRQGHFVNEADTDFSLCNNRLWAQEIIREWLVSYHEIPLTIAGKSQVSPEMAQGLDPSRPQCKIHTYFLAQEKQVEEALDCAKSQSYSWAETPLSLRVELLKKVAQNLRRDRKRLIGAMLQESAKNIHESDSEISEAIDFCEYYAKEVESYAYAQKMFCQAKVALVATPWNFPLSIPCSAIASSLAAGYTVIFKPAPEAVLSGWLLAQAFWQAGVSSEVLQFLTCRDEPTGTTLITDPRIDTVILTGATSTANYFLQKRPTLQLFAETGGKNNLIVTAISDRDLAVKDIVHSAFGYAGQKCSACSLLILEEEVYTSQSFRQQLVDAASHLAVGQSYHPESVVTPLIRPPSPHLLRAMTTLEDGEEWLLKPQPHPDNPHLWSPGIKLGVKPNSFMHQTELFGPVLAVMRAKNLNEAIDFANGTRYGLTAGLHSLDPQEHEFWKSKIIAGNCYINRQITGAIVARQPFGGCKESSFGPGMKVGGPNYLIQLGTSHSVPSLGQHDPMPQLLALELVLRDLGARPSDLDRFFKGVSSMTFWWDNYFSQPRILRRLVGQDNLLEFRPRSPLFLLLQENDLPIDIFLVLAAAKICGCKLICGATFRQFRRLFRSGLLPKIFEEFSWEYGTDVELLEKIQVTQCAHLRTLEEPATDFLQAAAGHISAHDAAKPSINGRFELIHYLREVAISFDYHRYGNLMEREKELREQVK